MAKIVGIHGIAQQYCGSYQLTDIWFSALRDGLAAAGHDETARELVFADVKVAFFGDLFRPEGTMAAADPPYTAADIRPGPERELLTALYDTAVDQDPELRAPEGAMGGGMATVQFMLSQLARSKTFAKVAQRAFIGNLSQVSEFLTDAAVKDRVLARVREQVGPDTQVVIGHSLGSVVAYEYLCRERPEQVTSLVTVGSPLGIRNVVFDRLTPAPASGAGAWPGTVATWVNVADPDDVVALRKDLAPLFPGSTPARKVTDRLVDNGDDPHAIDRYLNSRQAGSALGDALA